MGINIIDLYSVGHLMGGVLSRLVIFPNNKFISFIVGLIIHILIEFLEHEYNPISGKIIETKKNKVFDIIFYLIGWTIGEIYYENFKLNGISYYYYLVLLVFGYIMEFSREIFPYNKFFHGAFVVP